MTATAYETINTPAAIQAVLDANFSVGHRVVITPSGSEYVTIVLYDTT